MRVAVFLLLAFVSLFAFEKRANYDVEYGWFKELGDAKAVLTVNGQNYHIKIEAKTQGVAKFISRNREEVYESYGILTPKGYLPSKFVQYKKWSNKAERTTYFFNHAEKKVLKVKEKYEDSKLSDKNTEENKYYADNDILTLYFNISDDFVGMKAGSQKVYFAVGANPKDGRVDLVIPSGEKLSDIKEAFDGVKASSYVIVYINQKIFSSDRGELWIAFDYKNDCVRATLKDVLFFGDVRGILKN
jgi:hypothetical protein